jgi:hypothetical protein
MLLISRPNTILGEACCLRITDPLVAYMDANNGTDASVSAVYSLDEYTLLTVVCYAVRYVIDIRRRYGRGCG